MSYVIKQQGLKGGNLPRSGLLEPDNREGHGIRKMFRIVIYAVACVLVIDAAPEHIQANQKKMICANPHSGGVTKTTDDLTTILLEHKKWVETHGQAGKQANLTGANLKGIDLTDANLSNAHLIEADLSDALLINANLGGADFTNACLLRAFLTSAELGRAILTKADLTDATLSGAKVRDAVLRETILNGATLEKADLTDAFLQEAKLIKTNLGNAILKNADLNTADLREADLTDADLGKADLTESNLTRANLNSADLSGVTLKNVKLKCANLTHTNLQGTYFEPENFEKLRFLGAEGFSTIEFGEPTPIVILRNIAKDSGFRNEERALTSALYKHRLNAGPLHERIFEYMLIGLPTDFGANPWRSLLFLFFFIIFFSFIYNRSLKRDGEDGIWRVWILDRIRKDLGSKDPIRLTLAGFDRMKVAFYFSFLSAFSIGLRELNVGYWIARLQRREYTLRPTGWIRTVSGLQSLISVYFLTLWALTYFGRPFE